MRNSTPSVERYVAALAEKSATAMSLSKKLAL